MRNNDPATLKRAIAGSLTQTILDILQQDSISNDALRLIIGRFFTDEDLMRRYLSMISRADKKGIELWQKHKFKLAFKDDLIIQFSHSVWKTRDSFAVLALMSGEYRPRSQDITGGDMPKSLEVLYGQRRNS